MVNNNLRIFTGNANPELAQKICGQLDIALGQALVSAFSDGEIRVEIGDNVRGRERLPDPVHLPAANHNLMELLIMIDAVKRASARRITAVMPYFGYARQDRKVAPRVPITAKLVADLLTTAGADRILTMDLHAGQLQGFFDIPVDNLYASPLMIPYIIKNFNHDLAIVSPDAGGVPRARAYAKRLGPPSGSSTKGGTLRARPRPCTSSGGIGQGSGYPGRHHRHRRHPIRSGPGHHPERRPQNPRLLHPCRAFRSGGGARPQLGVEPTGGYRHHPPKRSAQNCPKIVQLSVASLLARAIMGIHRKTPSVPCSRFIFRFFPTFPHLLWRFSAGVLRVS